MRDKDGYLLQVQNLSLKRDGCEILSQVNLTIRPGEVHGLLGLNGSGKSSLAYTLMGCAGYTPDTGRIWFAGQDITAWPISERARLGLTLAWQEPARYGEGARGMTKTRIAVRDRAVSEVFTTAEGNAPFTRGHMDCTEIVRDQATARNMPLVVVRDDRAHVTHEAAIGTVNRKELETLMARGLDEESAVDVIIRGMLQ